MDAHRREADRLEGRHRPVDLVTSDHELDVTGDHRFGSLVVHRDPPIPHQGSSARRSSVRDAPRRQPRPDASTAACIAATKRRAVSSVLTTCSRGMSMKSP